MKRRLAFLVLFFVFTSVFAEYSSLGIPDSSDIRKELVETWFEASLDEIRDNIAEIRSNQAGQKFRISIEESSSTYAIVVAAGKIAEVNVYSNDGVTRVPEYVYPGTLPGTWVLLKDKKTEKPLSIRYYFTGDSEVYVQFTQYGKVALADLIIFGYYASKGSPTGVPFSTFYTASLDDVIKLTKKSIPWNYVLVNNSLYDGTLTMISEINRLIPKIVLLDNAMYDEDDKLINVIDGKPFDLIGGEDDRLYLSNAGCVKWVADGLVFPVSHTRLKRGPLVQSTVNVNDIGYQGILAQKNSLYFSLDWVRNIASAVISVNTGRKYLYTESGVDVNINPFSSAVTKEGNSNTINYIKNTGYDIKLVKSLLYVLAATEPDTVYLGAIREVSRDVKPEVKVFNKCAVFLPYFNNDNAFNCKVFFNGRMMSLEDFILIYGDSFVYFTRMRASQKFSLYEKLE